MTNVTEQARRLKLRQAGSGFSTTAVLVRRTKVREAAIAAINAGQRLPGWQAAGIKLDTQGHLLIPTPPVEMPPNQPVTFPKLSLGRR